MKSEQHDEQEPVDRLIDVFLEEMLGGSKPPDLSQRILAAHRATHSPLMHSTGQPCGVAPAVVDQNVVPPIVSAVPIQPGLANDNPATTARTQVVRASQPSLSQDSIGLRGWLAFGVAACAVALLVVLGLFKGEYFSKDTLANDPAIDGTSELKSPADATVLAEHTPPVEVHNEVLSLDDVPFGKPANNEMLANEGSAAQVDIPAALESREVVAELNSRFAKMWSQLEVVPTAEVSLDNRVRRVFTAFTGRAPAEGLSSDANNNLSSANVVGAGSIDEVFEQSLARGEFGKRWAQLLVEQWLGGGRLSAEQSAALEGWMAERINSRQPWNTVPLELLGGVLPAEQSSGIEPSALLVAGLAGGENHLLVERIGSAFLNSNLKCARCHDGQNGPRDKNSQSAYWSLVALLKGVDAGQDAVTGSKWIVDKQSELFGDTLKSPSVFFDRPNGVLQAAEARLPDGRLWGELSVESPRRALATWISQSSQFSDATVNDVWTLVFGKPLVPPSLNIENAAIDERLDMLRFVSAQFRAHNYDLPQLVSWLVSSRAFGLEPVRVDRQRWLALTPAELDSFQLMDRVFAAGPAPERRANLEEAVEAVVEWKRRDGRVETLAQPILPSTNSAIPSSSVETAFTELDESFWLHATRPTLTQQNFVTKLLRAKLSWEERVEHIVGLSEVEFGEHRVQHLAKLLLEENGGDPRAALLQLLWCVQHQRAS